MRIRHLVLWGVLTCSIAGIAPASVFTDDLARCLVRATTSGDRQTIMRTIFFAAAANPALAGLTSISAEQRHEGLRAAAAIYDRLMLDDCRAETIEVLRNDGPASLELAFQTLGQLAAREMINSPEGAAVLNQLTGLMDTARLEAMAREAGITTTGQ